MTKKQAGSVMPENVDDMTDEQVSEMLAGMQGGAPDIEEDSDKPAEAQDADAAQDNDTDEGAQEDGQQQAPKAGTVDFKRFDYERNRRKEAEAKAAENEAKWAQRYDELMKFQQARQEQRPEEAPAIPEWEEDPIARMQSVERRIEEFMSGVKGQTEEQKAAQQQREQEQWAIATADQTFAKAAPQNPDLNDAMNFAIQAVQKELQAKGYYGPAFQQEYQRQLVNYAANAPQEPAEFAEYVRRNARYWGWTGPQAQPSPPAQQAQQVDTGEAQRRAKTLSNGGGSPGVSDTISPEQLLAMSDKEFDAYKEKYGSVSAVFS